jgi:hypothetical protein
MAAILASVASAPSLADAASPTDADRSLIDL